MKFNKLSAVILASFLLVFFSHCKPSSKSGSSPFEFAEFITTYGPKSPSKLDNIFLGFNKKELLPLTVALLEENFSISPTVTGEIKIQDEKLIVFIPEQPLKSGTNYVVSLNLKNLVQSPQKLPSNTFSFDLKTIPQNVRLSVQDLFVDKDDWKSKLRIVFNDKEDVESVEKALVVKQGRKKLPFQLRKISAYEVEATISDIDMSKANSNLLFELNKGEINIIENVSTTFSLPDPSKFELVKTKTEPNKIIFLFSQILDKTQNLNGLIKLDSEKKSPKYDINGNQLVVYKSKSKKTNQNVSISKKLSSKSGMLLANSIEYQTDFKPVQAKLLNVGIGHIIPTTREVVFPFEAQGLASVEIEVFKVYSKNLDQFYQQSKLSNYYNLEYVGEPILTQRLDLKKLSQSHDPTKMMRYFINLKDLVTQEENALYEVRIGFTPDDVTSDCVRELDFDRESIQKSIFESNYYGIGGRYENFDWDDRENPCKLAFYNTNNYIKKLVLSSNIGIIVKKASNGDLNVIVNNIQNSKPIENADVVVYNKANRELLVSKTDKKGFLSAKDLSDAYLIKVTKSKDENWIRVQNQDALSLSKFDVNGRSKKNGIDGFIYGERNIWRPGDSMFIDFVLYDPTDKLPANHPVKLVLENNMGKIVFTEKTTENNGRIYPFVIPTKRDFLTGDYIIHAYVGGNKFSKFIKIENIKPNKFSIRSSIEKTDISEYRSILKNGKEFDYEVNWLYGAPGKNKRLQVEMTIDNAKTSFTSFPEFRFTDPRNEWYPPEPKIIADTKTNNSGSAKVKVQLDSELKPKGMLKFKFKNTAFEDSGDFSVDGFSAPYSPYGSYVGVKLPMDDYNYKRVSKNIPTNVTFASSSEKDKPAGNRKITVNVYKMENYWWYGSYNNRFDMTNMSIHVSDNKLQLSTDSKGIVNTELTFQTNGRYFVQVCDDLSGHCSGDYLYVGYAWDDGGMTTQQYEEAAQLNLSSVKPSYKKGETAEIIVPSYFEGRALVSLENGDKIVESFWTNVKRGNNKVEFTTQLEMFPTIYVHVTLLQDHASKANDMPIRLYGVVPIAIEDESLKLDPEIMMASELKPKETFTVKIAEKNKKQMYYTLAVVDEGLLNISRFKTPDPFSHFYSRPSLGVRTFDMYNEVLSAYGTEMSSLISIGGDMENIALEEDSRANRFKPVVQHLGPFFLEPSGKNTHEITLPNYIGAVRVMVVAVDKKSFGKQEKQVPVKQDLMMMATMPRSLAPGDKLDIPITLFTMKEGVGNIDYGVIQKDEFLKFDRNKASFNINSIDEIIKKMPATVGSKEGIANLGFYANSKGINSSQEIEIDIRNPNPIVHRTDLKYVEPGERLDLNVTPLGNKSEVTISMSTLTPFNVEAHLGRLGRYPYGCLEQRTSAAIAAIVRKDLIEVDEQTKARDKELVTKLINDLYRFQNTDGYALWPSSFRANDWLTSYIGDFLFMAKDRGFSIPESTINQWKSIQSDRASNWSASLGLDPSRRVQSIQQQAFRLYSLSLMGEEKLSEMNRLKEDYPLDINSSVLLAAAYSKSGRKDLAKTLLAEMSNQDQNNLEFTRMTYNAYPRNIALQILMYDELEDKQKIADLAKSLNRWLSENKYLSTHSAAFVVRAIAVMKKNFGSSKKVHVDFSQANQNPQALISDTGIISFSSDLIASTSYLIKNISEAGIYVEVTRSGKETLGSESTNSSKLKLITNYFDMAGNKIDPSSIRQGTDFKVSTTISKIGDVGSNYTDLALRQSFPSGWEIVNNRIFDFEADTNKLIDYQDYKDNQVNSFFSLETKSTITIDILMKATYGGEFYHPKQICESMYVDNIYAENKGFGTVVYQ